MSEKRTIRRSLLRSSPGADATLRELAELVKEQVPASRNKQKRLSFALVYPNAQGVHVLRHVGTISTAAGKPGGDDGRELRHLRFQTGDYLDVAII